MAELAFHPFRPARATDAGHADGHAAAGRPKKLRRWHLLVLLAGLLFLRAVFYRWMARVLRSGKLDLGVVAPSFRSDWFAGMLLFSFLSFGAALGIFYVGLLFLSLLSGPEPIHGLVKIPLGRVDGWPRWAKILLPFVGTAWFGG